MLFEFNGEELVRTPLAVFVVGGWRRVRLISNVDYLDFTPGRHASEVE